MSSVHIPKSFDRRLDQLAAHKHCSKDVLVKNALKQMLEDEEDLIEAEIAYEEYVKSGKKSYTLDEIKEMYDL